MSKLLRYLILPREITGFERAYLARMNRIALVFFWLHLPAFIGVALLAGTSPVLAGMLTAGALLGPTLAYRVFANPRTLSLVYGITAMLLGGILVFIGQGPMQIEMHFYFFVLIALLAVFGNPMAVLSATVTVAVHHLVVWLVFMRAVFNYDAPVWAVAVHALFVVLESVAACFVARSFFDNVIGLEKIVARRTAEVDARNRDLKLVLDNVGQGFLAVDPNGAIVGEPSRVVATWFGPVAAGQRLWDVIAGGDAEVRDALRLGWEGLTDGFLPVEVVLDQLPRAIVRGDTHLAIAYRAVGDREPPEQVVVVITDATAELAAARIEADQRELYAAMERAGKDRGGFVEFVAESERLVQSIVAEAGDDHVDVRRWIHTLKGNTALFGAATLAAQCHDVETRMSEDGGRLTEAERHRLGQRWTHYRGRIAPLVGDGERPGIEVHREELDAVIDEARGKAGTVVRRLKSWRHDSMQRRLERIGDQARALATRLGKGEIEVVIEHNRVRLPSERWAGFWSAFVHAVRNAVDHGLESPEERAAAGKPAQGRLTLRTQRDGDAITIELRDDGRGIAWDRVAARARALQLPAETPDDLRAALFTDGLSTRAEVDDVSGRGVGLGALAAAAQRLGGRIEVDGGPTGTTLRFTIPDQEVSQQLSAVGAFS